LKVEVVTLPQPALRRMRGHREISEFHGASSLLFLKRVLMRASESIARERCGGDMTKLRGEIRARHDGFFPSPLVGEGVFAERRRVRGCLRGCRPLIRHGLRPCHLLPQGEKGRTSPYRPPNRVAPNSAFCVEGC